MRYVPATTQWNAILSLFMGVTALISAEFAPISLLTPMAQSLNISEGIAGQSITVVGIFAVIASLTLIPLTQKINRRTTLLCLSLLLIVSNFLMFLTPNYIVLLIARALLGIAVGGFWSMASALALQLAKPDSIAKALSVIYAGVSIATILALPLATYLAEVWNWRTVFLLLTLLAIVTLLWQWQALPSLPAEATSNFENMFILLKRSWFLLGMDAMICSYAGYHIFFSFLRPYLETLTFLTAHQLVLTLLLFGLANCVSTLIAGLLLNRYFKGVMYTIPLLFIGLALLFLSTESNSYTNILLVIAWGIMFGFIPVGWTTWITKTIAEQAELAGGISVACIQLSIGLAASIGGFILDHTGIPTLFIASIITMFISLLLTIICFKRLRTLL